MNISLFVEGCYFFILPILEANDFFDFLILIVTFSTPNDFYLYQLTI